jgi:hypothetical protein
MKMNIDFKGKKFAITSKYIYFLVVATSNDVDDSIGFWKDRECDDWPKADFILHINPDYKESKEMNEHILLVMKYLDDKNSVSKQELKENANDANAAYAFAFAANAFADAAAADAAADAADAAAAAADAADAADAAANAADAVAEKWINRYFDHTKEDKQTYIDAINAGKESKEMKSDRLADEIMAKSKESVYTQEMKDKDLVPTEGMKFTYRKRDEEYTVLGVCESQNGKSTIITFEDFRNSIDCIYYSDDVLPIDQRTDSEKAIDDLILQINRVQYDANMSDMDLKDIIVVAFEAGISFTGDKK